MIEPTNAPVPTNMETPDDDPEISPGFSLQQNKPYQFMRNDELGGICVARVSDRYEARFSLNSSGFAPGPVSV